MRKPEAGKGSNVEIKLIAIGDTGVGKTSILTRFVSEKFNDFSEPTLGAAFLTKVHTLPSGQSVEFQIWDTAGQEKYKSIAPIYYRDAKVALCVYDICSMHSYQVLKNWVKELQENGPKDIILTVVGNKIDCYEDEEVNYADVKDYASSIGATYKIVSAKEGKNIKDLFNTVAELAINKSASTPTTQATKPTGDVNLGGKPKRKRNCC